MKLVREQVDRAKFNQSADLPYSLRLTDFEVAMQDVYDFFFDVNTLFFEKSIPGRSFRTSTSMDIQTCSSTGDTPTMLLSPRRKASR